MLSVHNIICLGQLIYHSIQNFFFCTIRKYSLKVQCHRKYSHWQINVIMTAHTHTHMCNRYTILQIFNKNKMLTTKTIRLINLVNRNKNKFWALFVCAWQHHNNSSWQVGEIYCTTGSAHCLVLAHYCVSAFKHIFYFDNVVEYTN